MPAPKKIDADREKLEKILSSYVQPYNISNLKVHVVDDSVFPVFPSRLVAEMDINNQHLECTMSQYKKQYSFVGFSINNKYFNPLIGGKQYTIDDGVSLLTNMIQKIHNNDSPQGIFSLETPTKGDILYK